MMEFRLSASMISCLICLRQINIDFHNTNFRLMGDYKKIVEAFDAFIKSKDTNRNETLFQSISLKYDFFKGTRRIGAAGLQRNTAASRYVYI